MRLLTDCILTPDTPEAARLQVRYQQVTGALLAKSHEDTAGFRWNAYIAANEVGADPDEVTITTGASSTATPLLLASFRPCQIAKAV